MYFLVASPWIRPLGTGILVLLAGLCVYEFLHQAIHLGFEMQLAVGLLCLVGLFTLKGVGRKTLMVLGMIGCFGWAYASQLAADEPDTVRAELAAAARFPRGGCADCTGSLLDDWITRAPPALRVGWLAASAGKDGDYEVNSTRRRGAAIACGAYYAAVESLATDRLSDRNSGDVEMAILGRRPMPAWTAGIAGDVGSEVVEEAFARPFVYPQTAGPRPGGGIGSAVERAIRACAVRFPEMTGR